jgi:hypothetical protein
VTATRSWVRFAARWIARIDGVSGQLRLAMLALTGISTATLTLKQYGYGQYAWPVIAVITAVTVVYTYLYTEGGVWNQVARDRTDMSDNYSGPTMLFDAKIDARQRSEQTIAIIEALTEEPVPEDRREQIRAGLDSVTVDEWRSLREGVNVEELKQ